MVEVTQADERAARASWNAFADTFNKWENLSHSEQQTVAGHFATHRAEAVAALEARVRELEGALAPFASEADARRNNLNGAVCFPQSFLIAARKALHDPR